jgi:aminoglycoside 6'-N-acetyltransferase
MPLRQLRALPERLDTDRLFLRPYRAEDTPWYFAMGQRNRDHLARHESGNSIFSIHCEADAARVLRDFAAQWQARTAFVLGVFLRDTEEFVGQIYLGVTNDALPALNLGFFADCAHVNQGYLTEAARRALAFAFDDLGAHRVGLWCDDTNTPAAAGSPNAAASSSKATSARTSASPTTPSPVRSASACYRVSIAQPSARNAGVAARPLICT